MKNWKRMLMVVLSLSLLLAMAACGNGNDPATSVDPSASVDPVTSADPDASAGSGTTKDTLNIALFSDIVSLDPIYAYDHTTNLVVTQITEGVMRYDENAELATNLAESWEAVDATTYVYQIRSDVKFSDGTPMTMDDVIYSLERHRNQDLASYLGWMFDKVDTMEATGDWELTIKLTEPDANWQYVLATTAGHVVSKAYCEDKGETFGKPSGGVMGTGPYMFKEWTTGSQVTLERNPNYRGDAAKIQNVNYLVFGEDTTRVAAINAGQVDMMMDPPEDMLDQLEANADLEVEMIDTMMIMFFGMNTSKPPFDDINVRRAIASAVDKQAIMDNIIKQSGTIGTGMPFSEAGYGIAPDVLGSYAASAKNYTYDMEKAKEYLAQSAYPDGFQTTIMHTAGNSVRESISLILQQSLAELGIEAEIVSLPGEEQNTVQFGSNLVDGTRDYDIGVFRWEADYPDISGNLVPLYHSANKGAGGANCTEYTNSEVDRLLDEQSKLTDNAERVNLMTQAMDIVIDEAPLVVVDYPKKIAVLRTNVQGFNLNTAWVWNFNVKDITVE